MLRRKMVFEASSTHTRAHGSSHGEHASNGYSKKAHTRPGYRKYSHTHETRGCGSESGGNTWISHEDKNSTQWSKQLTCNPRERKTTAKKRKGAGKVVNRGVKNDRRPSSPSPSDPVVRVYCSTRFGLKNLQKKSSNTPSYKMCCCLFIGKPISAGDAAYVLQEPSVGEARGLGDVLADFYPAIVFSWISPGQPVDPSAVGAVPPVPISAQYRWSS